ncbi:hypothetical protein [Trueperella pyogenes]|nr:hypothetical protein [Trueperella pyogenes]
MTGAELADMAEFVSVFKWRPRDYWTLTVTERNAIVEAHRRLNRG